MGEWTYKQKAIRKLLSVLFVFAGSLSIPASITPPTIPIKPEIYSWELENGLTVLFWRDTSSEVVSIRGYIKTGSMYEARWLGAGISHYCEHIVSGGSTKYRKEETYKKLLSRIGGRNNAYTTDDETCYYITTTKEYFSLADSILFEWLTACVFDRFEFEREKGVITEEIRMGNEEPQRIIWKLFSETIFLSHPKRFPVIGYLDRFKQLTREELIAYYNERYQPQNAILSIAGALDPESLYYEVRSVWGRWKRGSYYHPPLTEEPAQEIPRIVEKEYAGEIAYFRLGFHGVASGSEYEYPLEFAAYILTGNEHGRLRRRIKNELGLATSIWAYNSSPLSGGGTFVIGGDFDYSKKDSLFKTIMEELEKLATEGPSEEELELAKQSWYRGLLSAFEGTERLASIAASNWEQYRDPFPYEKILAKAFAVMPEDVREACRRFFKPYAYTLVILKPKGAKSTESPANIKRENETYTIERMVLPNGMKIIYAYNPALPFFDLAVYLQAGLRGDPPERPGLSSITADYILEGTEKLNREKLFTLLDRMGAQLSASSGNNTIGINMKFLKEDFDSALNIFADVVLHPAFPERSMERIKREKLASLRNQEAHWSSRLHNNFRKNYFINHPYRYPGAGTKESIEAITLDDIKTFYNKYFVGGNMTLAISGPLRPSEVAEKIGEKFKSVAAGKFEIQPYSGELLLQGDTVITIPDEGEQVSFAMGFPAPVLGDTLTAVIKVIDAMISGVSLPRGWLHESLRGKEDLVYIVSGTLWQGPDIGTYYIIAQTSPKNYPKVIEIVKRQIARLAKGNFPESEVEEAKHILRINLAFQNEYQSSRVTNWALNELYGLGYNYDEELQKAIERVTKREIINYSKVYFSNYKLIVMKPKEHQ